MKLIDVIAGLALLTITLTMAAPLFGRSAKTHQDAARLLTGISNAYERIFAFETACANGRDYVTDAGNIETYTDEEGKTIAVMTIDINGKRFEIRSEVTNGNDNP